MATTPDLTLQVESALIDCIVSTSSGTDRLEVWRIIAGGVYTRIAYSVTMQSAHGQSEGTFADYNAPHGVPLTYYARAVDGSGGTANSPTQSATLTLASGSVHAITKTSGVSNAYSDALLSNQMTIYDQWPQQQAYDRAGAVYMLGNATVPTRKQSDIEHGMVTVVARVPDSNTQALRAIVTSRRYVCYRDALGGRFFGKLKDYKETYQNTFIDAAIGLEILNYDESVNS